MPGKIHARHKPVKDKRPRCPLHEVPMEYYIEELHWSCPTEGCAQIAFPRAEVSKGRPIVGRGDLEVFVMTDPDSGRQHVFLRALENNVLLDITDICSASFQASAVHKGGMIADIAINGMPVVKAE